jgi:hypothetical protein
MTTIRVVLLGLALTAIAVAQTPTGTIQGIVEDSSGAVMPDATIKIVNVNTNEVKDLRTDAGGRYLQPFLLPGTYSVTAEKEGFRPVRQDNILLDVGQNRSVDLKLEVGSTRQEIVVEGTPPPLDTNTSTVGQIIENKRIIDLPLNGRSVLALSELAPGVNPTADTITAGLGGGRANASVVQVDGTTATPPYHYGLVGWPYQPQVDAVDEFNVAVSTLAAEYGRTGGGVVSVVTKSGTNTLHGSAYDFIRNSKLGANDFFSNRTGRALPSYKRNQYGGVVGGPIYIPGVYDGRNKTFFFVGYENTPIRSASSSFSTVPTAAWRQGDFSGLKNASGQPITIYDPATAHPDPANPTTKVIRDPFPNNVIPQASIDPGIVSLLKYYPAPTAGLTPSNPYTMSNNYFNSGVSRNDSYKIDTRVDHNFTDRWRMFLRTSIRKMTSLGFNAFDNIANYGTATEIQKQPSISMDHTLTLSSTLLVNLRGGLNRVYNPRTPISYGFDITSIGLPKYVQGVAPDALFPTVSLSNFTSLGSANATLLRWSGTTYSSSATVTKILAKHTLKAGYNYEKYLLNHWQPDQPDGAYNFDSGWTQLETSTSSTTAGFGLASMLLGLPSSGYLSHAMAIATASSYWGFYVQDDWKVTRTLSFNIGLRYDFDTPFTERYNRMSYWDMNAVSPIQSAIPASACRSCGNLRGAMQFLSPNNRQVAPIDSNNLGPRIGLAWNVRNNLVVRAAYGILFQQSVLTASPLEYAAEGYQTNTNMTTSFDSGRTINARWSDPFPQGFHFPTGSTLGAGTNLGFGAGGSNFGNPPSPKIQQWNLNVQRTMPGNIVVEVGYLGNRGQYLPDLEGYSLNQNPVSDLTLGPSLLTYVENPFYGVITDPLSSLSRPTVQYMQLLKPYPQYTGMTTFMAYPRSDSIYHAGTIRVDKRFSHGLSLLASYTKAKTIDNSSSTIHFIGAMGAGKLDNYNLRNERSISAQDVAQRLVLSYVWELPFGKGRRLLNKLPAVANGFLGGWQVNGITAFQSGLPLIIRPAYNNTYIGTGERPNTNGQSARITGGTVDERIALWFDTSTFSQPADYTLGNVSRTINVRAPGRKTTDLSLFKDFMLLPEQRMKLQFRAEAFGVFNTPQWGTPGTTVASGTFGKISSASGQRQMQLALKLVW